MRRMQGRYISRRKKFVSEASDAVMLAVIEMLYCALVLCCRFKINLPTGNGDAKQSKTALAQVIYISYSIL